MERDKFEQHLKRGLTVKQLREELENYDDDTPVVFSYNYGDHWRTEVAQRIDEVTDGPVVWSEYHRMPKLDDEGDEDENVQVVILK